MGDGYRRNLLAWLRHSTACGVFALRVLIRRMAVARNIPDWPRSMQRGMAAAYCDLPPVDFDREVFAGRLPAGFMLGGKEHWSRVALDESLADLAGEGAGNWRKNQKAYRDAA